MYLVPNKKLLEKILARSRNKKRALTAPLHVLVRRVLDGYEVGKDDDGNTVAVCTSTIGALPASAVNAGGLAVFEQLDLNKVVDAWVGPSTASINNIFAMTGSVVSGMRIYPEVLNDKAFFNMLRYPVGPVADLAYLVYEHLDNTFPLSWDEIVKSPQNKAGNFITVATDACSGEAVALKNFENKPSLQAAQVAAMFVPGVSQYGTKPSFEYKGQRLAEGGISDPTGVLTAVKEVDPTHLVAMNGWPVGTNWNQYAFYESLAVYAAIYAYGWKHHELGVKFSGQMAAYRKTLGELTLEAWQDKALISLFAPANTLPQYHFLDHDPDHLWECVMAGYDGALNQFGLTTDDLPVPKLWSFC